MQKLDEIQNAFVAGVIEGHDVPLRSIARMKKPWQLETYRNNYRGALVKAIHATYRHSRALLGDGKFQALANSYVDTHPSTNRDLNDYSAGLPKWLDEQATVPLPRWIPDVARLDWHKHRSYYAPNASDFDPASFSRMPMKQQLGLSIQTLPSVRLLQSHWPLDQIVQSKLLDPVRSAEVLHFLVDREQGIPRLKSCDGPMWQLLWSLIEPATAAELLERHEQQAARLPEALQQGWVRPVVTR